MRLNIILRSMKIQNLYRRYSVMTTITLKYGYYIEIDPLNYTLRQKFKGQTREGQEKDSVRNCGYFGNI